MNKEFFDNLDFYIPTYKCELNYNKDYELLIATVLSAQCTDKRVNKVTEVLFNKYNLNELSQVDENKIANIIKSCGSYTKKSKYIKEIAISLINNYGGKVPNNRDYLESLPGVGRKTANVVLKNLFNEPCIPVDTHVIRVSNRLGIVQNEFNPNAIERVLMQGIPRDKWNKVGEQLLLFGRYYCKSKKPICKDCRFKKICKKENL